MTRTHTVTLNCETCSKSFDAETPDDRSWLPDNQCSDECRKAYEAKMKAEGWVTITPENHDEILDQLKDALNEEAVRMNSKPPKTRLPS